MISTQWIDKIIVCSLFFRQSKMRPSLFLPTMNTASILIRNTSTFFCSGICNHFILLFCVQKVRSHGTLGTWGLITVNRDLLLYLHRSQYKYQCKSACRNAGIQRTDRRKPHRSGASDSCRFPRRNGCRLSLEDNLALCRIFKLRQVRYKYQINNSNRSVPVLCYC